MREDSWSQVFSEMADATWGVFVKFWKHDIWPLLSTMWLFFVLAVPLLIVILILWYLDSIGWRAEGGYYKIGAACVWATIAV